jgi:hypothetical protein
MERLSYEMSEAAKAWPPMDPANDVTALYNDELQRLKYEMNEAAKAWPPVDPVTDVTTPTPVVPVVNKPTFRLKALAPR